MHEIRQNPCRSFITYGTGFPAYTLHSLLLFQIYTICVNCTVIAELLFLVYRPMSFSWTTFGYRFSLYMFDYTKPQSTSYEIKYIMDVV